MENVFNKQSLIFRISELCHIIDSCRITGSNPNPYYDELDLLLDRYHQSKSQQSPAGDASAGYLLPGLR